MVQPPTPPAGPSRQAALLELSAAALGRATVHELLVHSVELLRKVLRTQDVAIVSGAGDAEVVDAGRPLPAKGSARVEVLGGSTPRWLVLPEPALGSDADESFVEALVGILGAGMARRATEEALRDSEHRHDRAQELAQMGSYDWDIASDDNRWSDQLYRIYGLEPQSENIGYERFISFIHPEDRERILAVHRRAYESGESYEMIERIIRPDGEVRTLLSNGEVMLGADGRPVRMRGTCLDITERMRAEAEASSEGRRFKLLIETAPDAIVAVGPDGGIRHANPRAASLLGYAVETLAALPASAVFDDLRAGMDRTVRHAEGHPIAVDVTLAELDGDGFVVFLREAAERRRRERFSVEAHDHRLRRRHALDINDGVIQGLVATLHALEHDDLDAARPALTRTLAAARRVVDGLLEAAGDLDPGDLVRGTAVVPVLDRTEDPGPGGGRLRVLIADDAADLRYLLTLALHRDGRFTVVGEAADGHRAVDLATELQPDLIVLDLAMPLMDGLQALPLIRRRCPDARILVLTGFEHRALAESALDDGADGFLEKGTALPRVAAELATLMATPRETPAAGV